MECCLLSGILMMLLGSILFPAVRVVVTVGEDDE